MSSAKATSKAQLDLSTDDLTPRVRKFGARSLKPFRPSEPARKFVRFQATGEPAGAFSKISPAVSFPATRRISAANPQFTSGGSSSFSTPSRPFSAPQSSGFTSFASPASSFSSNSIQLDRDGKQFNGNNRDRPIFNNLGLNSQGVNQFGTPGRVFGVPTIVRQSFNAPITPDSDWNYAYETSHGIKQEASGGVKQIGDVKVVVMRGSYEYVGVDGLTYKVDWFADETGFHAEGAHLPRNVPIPFPDQQRAVDQQISFAAQQARNNQNQNNNNNNGGQFNNNNNNQFNNNGGQFNSNNGGSFNSNNNNNQFNNNQSQFSGQQPRVIAGGQTTAASSNVQTIVPPPSQQQQQPAAATAPVAAAVPAPTGYGVAAEDPLVAYDNDADSSETSEAVAPVGLYGVSRFP